MNTPIIKPRCPTCKKCQANWVNGEASFTCKVCKTEFIIGDGFATILDRSAKPVVISEVRH